MGAHGLTQIKRLFVGEPIETAAECHQRLRKRLALPIFSSDALSSSAYATEAILIALGAAGAMALGMVIYIAFGIALLLITVAFSYRQTINAYPQGGGTYVVTKENLGVIPSLTAAASLLIDYILTVAVSMSAAVAAITSALEVLAPYRVELAIALIALVTLVNLRGLKESGLFFAGPTYVFVAAMFIMIAVGIVKVITGQVIPAPMPREPHLPLPQELHSVSVFLVLRAFAAGCTALTGVEAIADGTPSFEKPEAKNAITTLIIMASILIALFLGITFMASAYHIVPDGSSHPETANSQLARAIFGGTSPFYYLTQISTMLILILASNTAYADFPRLSSFLARDSFIPRQFGSRGDRLVFSNGIITLGVLSGLIVIAFGAKEQALLPLYAVGVFNSFTLSQYGMVKRWLNLRTTGWLQSAAINAVGATITGVVLVVLAVTKFSEGAWAILVAVPILVLLFKKIQHHYAAVAAQLTLDHADEEVPCTAHRAILLVSGIHRGVLPSLEYAHRVAGIHMSAAYVNTYGEDVEKLQAKWRRWGNGYKLYIIESPHRQLIAPILKHLDEMQHPGEFLTVILPTFIPAKWWQHLLHNQSAALLRFAITFNKRVKKRAVVTIPYDLER